MFSKCSDVLEHSSSFYSQPMDFTDPAKYTKGSRSSYKDLCFYQEKQVFDILLQESISQADFQRLYLLVHIPISEENCLTKKDWIPIAQLRDYESIQFRHNEFKSLILKRLEENKTQAQFIFVTPKGKSIYLLRQDSDKLDKGLIALIQENAREGRDFNLTDLLTIKTKILEAMRHYACQATPESDQLILGFVPMDKILNREAYERFQEYRKLLTQDIPFLIEAIVKMRFYLDFEGRLPKLEHKLQSALSAHIKQTGFSPLANFKNDLDDENKLGETAVMTAIKQQSDYASIELVIKNTKQIDDKNNKGYRALDLAINLYPHPNCLLLIQALLAKGASPKLLNDEGNSPLLQAAYCCSLEILKCLFQQAPELLNEPNHQGETVLSIVLQREAHTAEALEIIPFLIQQGANPVARNKEGKNAFALVEKNPQFKAQLETSVQAMADTVLTKEMFLDFIASFCNLLKKTNYSLTKIVESFLKHYRAYLHSLDAQDEVSSFKPRLIGLLNLLEQHPDFSVRYSNKILQDILTGGEGYKNLIHINPDLIDGFSFLEIASQAAESEKLPSSVGFGRSLKENKLLFFDECSNFFHEVQKIWDQQVRDFGEDFSFLLNHPGVLCLPKETLKLMYRNQLQCRQLIKLWGFGFDQFKNLTQVKIDLLLTASFLIPELKMKGIPISQLVDLSEDRLALLLSRREGFYILFHLGMSLDRFNSVKRSHLSAWLEHKEIISFLAQHHLSLMQILDIEIPKLILLSRHLNPLAALAKSDSPLDEIVKLPIEELISVLEEHQDQQTCSYHSSGKC